MALRYSQVLLRGDHLFHRARVQGEFLLLHFEHLARESDQLQRGFELIPGLVHPFPSFVDIPNGLILRILQLHLQPPLLQQRPFGVRLTRPIAEGDVERQE